MSEMSVSAATEVAEVAPLSIMRELYNPELDFRQLALEAQYFSKGFRLIDKNELLGVPFVIIGVTYRDGFRNGPILGDYISVEAVVADKDTMSSPQVRHQVGDRDLTVYPNEAVVFNDGGTGIRRDLTELFSNMGLIDPGLPAKDQNRYDRPMSLWAEGADLAASGINADDKGNVFRYIAMRGLRVSKYEIPEQYGKGDASTYYFA